MVTSTSNKIVVIGSNSFSGASFVDHALTQGHQVIGMSRSPEYHPVFLPYSGNNRKSAFKFHQLDLNSNGPEILEAIGEFKPDFVFNFAAQSMVAESWVNPLHWYHTNVIANVALHEGLRKMAFLKKYVHISTPEVYGSTAGLIKEDARFNPSTPYAASRAACELHLNTYIKNYGFPVVFTRAANVFGPSQQLYRIIPRTVLFVKLGKKIQLHGGGHSVRSFIHINDVSRGTLLAAHAKDPGAAFHFSTTRQISIRDCVATICEMMGTSFDNCVEVVGDRPGKDSAYLLDSAKAKSELGWQPEISLEKGIQEVINWVNANFETLKNQPMDYIHKP